MAVNYFSRLCDIKVPRVERLLHKCVPTYQYSPMIGHRAYHRSDPSTLLKADGYRGVTYSAGHKLFNGLVTP